MDSTLVSILATLVILATVAAAGYWSYENGYLDDYINSIGAYMAKAKAEAALKEVQGVEGLKAMGEKTNGNQRLCLSGYGGDYMTREHES
ncbi:hypothetical protein B0J13DRAFT_549301 [Dactylonectria estremocensis]|uniref:Uncharacterized protein n=1 Tax=Dactylonectria estremocensis TaxID=1079267 RepID=A0A9P9F2J2_9HYPO|nr:hypothetical protein B0J13DRAFT_549301 [Dactylonectria estremocensis]